MKTILIAGASAAGKSTLARWLTHHGNEAVSLDGHPGLCTWADANGDSVPWPTEPDLAWLRRPRWIWRPEILDALIAGAAAAGTQTLLLCGWADNARELGDRFDVVIGLLVDAQTVAQRLDDPARANPYGRMGETRQLILDRLNDDQRQLADWADALVDARKPPSEVGEEVLAAALLALLRLQ